MTGAAATPAVGTISTPRLGSWLPAFAALAAIWGASFLFIKVAVEELHPIYIALGRCAAGALTLAVILLVSRDRLPRSWGLWGRFAAVAAIGNVLPFILFGYGEQRISSILAGIWNGTTPLTVLAVVMVFVPAERPTRQRVLGLAIGFIGVLVVLGAWRGVTGDFVGQLCCFGAAICYGFGIPGTRHIVKGRTESGVALAAAQLIMATAELLVLAPLFAGAPPALPSLSAAVVWSVLGLGALGTGVAFWLNIQVIRVAGATTSASVTYLIPVFSTLLGVLVLREPLTWYEPIGAMVVLVGVAVSQGAVRRPLGAT